MGMLIEISGCHMPGPLDRPLIRLQLPGHDTHEGGLSLTVGTHKADMFSLQKPKGYIPENLTVTKTVGEVFYIQNTHFLLTPRKSNHSAVSITYPGRCVHLMTS
jgi:hypothetical protein